MGNVGPWRLFSFIKQANCEPLQEKEYVEVGPFGKYTWNDRHMKNPDQQISSILVQGAIIRQTFFIQLYCEIL